MPYPQHRLMHDIRLRLHAPTATKAPSCSSRHCDVLQRTLINVICAQVVVMGAMVLGGSTSSCRFCLSLRSRSSCSALIRAASRAASRAARAVTPCVQSLQRGHDRFSFLSWLQLNAPCGLY